ncbi:extended Signal Peptide of Type V secretion system family protein [Escherichia coli 3-073-06_S4_C3]|nr:extended Signal Peptide of Type V secretion system family protein [Escherichia coli 3-073-06_S4_C3]
MKRHLNTCYRLVWNHITGAFVVASELARARGKRGGVAVALSLAAVTSLPVLAADIVVHPGETVNGGTLVNHDNQFVSGTADGVTVSTGLELGPDCDDNTGGQWIKAGGTGRNTTVTANGRQIVRQVAVPRIRLSVPVEDRICAGRLTVLSLTVVNNGYMQAAVHPER